MNGCARSSSSKTSRRFRPFPFALPHTPALAELRSETRSACCPARRAASTARSPSATAFRPTARYCAGRAAMPRRWSSSRSPRLPTSSGFALGVQLFVEREEGVVLFQLRAASIGRDPLLWTASASGGLMPREEPRTAVLADAAEEIALGEDDLEGFRPVARLPQRRLGLGARRLPRAASLGSRAGARRDEGRRAALGSSPRPSIGAQVSGDTVACWDALERWRELAARRSRSLT